MDPNTALKRLRELAKEIHETVSPEDLFDLSDEMATLFEGLDEWLSKRSALPDDWRRLPLLPPDDPDFEDPEPII